MRQPLARSLALFPAPLLAFVLALRPVENFDLGFILRLGEWVQLHGIPVTDPFSFPGEGKQWVVEQWLGPLVFWQVYAHAGLAALLVFKALVIAAAFALVYLAAREACGNGVLAALAGLLGAAAGAVRFNAQPFVFSFLGTAAISLALHRLRARRSFWPLAALPPIFALWPHVHPGYLSGLALLGAFTAGALLEALLFRARPAGLGAAGPAASAAADSLAVAESAARFRLEEAVLLGLVTAACAGAAALSLALFHPLGLAPLVRVLDIFSSDLNRQNISEYAPLWRSYQIDAPMLVLALLPPLSWALTFRRLSLPLAAAHLLFVVSAARVGRLVTDSAIVLAPIWAYSMLLVLQALSGSLVRLAKLATPGRLLALPLLLCLAAAAGPLSHLDLDWPEAYDPRSCYAWIDAHDLPPRQFNDLWFGGSFILHLAPGRKTFIDGRSFYSDQFFRDDYLPIRNAAPGWQRVAERWGIEWFLLRPDRFRGLHEALRKDPRYQLVHSEAQCTIYATREVAKRL